MFKIKTVFNYKPICTFIAVMCTASLFFNIYFALLIQEASEPKGIQMNVAPSSFDEYLQDDVQNIKYNVQKDYSYDDEMRENMRAYQLDFNNAGDVVVYDGKNVVGVLQYNTTCHLHKLLDRDND